MKLLAAMRNNPRDWRIEQLITIGRRLRIEVRSDGGSHHVFSHPDVAVPVCAPAHRPTKPIHVRAFVALCAQAMEANGAKALKEEEEKHED
ncbi:MAG: type II toxin-antitoxin system HicA family toxin [Candidatus Accumulibacter sp.]|nr:type II toxin-antitoxin system HicA family toxin [Accumulibacter sp.]